MSDFRSLLQPYIDGEIDELERLLLQEHLKHCGECREELNQLTALNWQLQGIRESITVPAGLSLQRNKAIEDHFMSIPERTALPLADLVRVQYTTWKNVFHSFHHLPGLRTTGLMVHYTRKTLANRVKKLIAVNRFFPVWGSGG